MRHPAAVALLLGLSLVLASSAPAETQLKVTRQSLSRVDVDGGLVQGLAVGSRLRILEGDVAVAELEVVQVAQRSARCKVVSLERPVRVGDVAVVVEDAEDPPVAAKTAPDTEPSARQGEPAEAVPAAPPPSSSTPSATTASSTTASTPKPPQEGGGPSGPFFTVQYLSAANVYVDGGRAAGLDVGRRLQVFDGPTVVAELEVLYAAERSASCKALSESRPVRPGDRAFLVGGAGPSPTSTPDAPVAAESSAVAVLPSEPAEASVDEASHVPWARARGAASLGYYRSTDGFATDLDYQERTARVDLGLYEIAGQPLSFALRARFRQDIRSRELSRRTPASLRTDRIYELALRYDPPRGRFAFELGRIGVSRFVGIGYLDGALVRYRLRPRLQIGAFGGRQADIANLDGIGGKYGAFVRLSPGGRYTRGGYDVLFAAVRENAEGEVSREYLSLESRFAGGGRWSVFQRAELDLNRGWRQEVTGKSYQFSNIGLTGNLRVTPTTWAYVTYSGLRNYRYYRNRLVPEDIFDSLLRQGLRAGLNLSKPGGFGATAGFGMSLKEQDPLHPDLDISNAYSFNGGVRHSNLFRGISGGLDGYGFTNGYTKGGMVSARAGWRAAAGHTVDLSYGYSRYRVEQTMENRTQQWIRLIGRGQLPRGLFVLGDLELDSGDDLKGPRAFVELGIVF
jgi:hypothetical protein